MVSNHMPASRTWTDAGRRATVDIGCDSGHHEEVECHDVGDVIAEKAHPCRRGRLPTTHQVLLDCGPGKVDTDLPQLALEVRRAPKRIRGGYQTDQISNVLGNRWLVDGW